MEDEELQSLIKSYRVFNVTFKQISHMVLVFSLLNLSFHTIFKCLLLWRILTPGVHNMVKHSLKIMQYFSFLYFIPTSWALGIRDGQ